MGEYIFKTNQYHNNVKVINMKILSIVFLIVFSFSSFSAVILKIKGQKALIDLEEASVQKGDMFDALNLYGKSKGLIEIRKIRKGKAIGVLRKGKMGVSWILEPAASNATSEEDNLPPLPVQYKEPIAPKKEPVTKKRKSIFKTYSSHVMGILMGPNLNLVRLSPSTSVSGIGWRGAIIADIVFTKRLSTRLSLSYKTLIIDGQHCERIINCKLSVQYPGAGALFRIKFFKHSAFHSWVGAGGSLLYPIPDKRKNMELHSKSFNGFHGVFSVAIGTDIHLQNIQFPIQIDANWINPVVISFKPLQSGARRFKPFYLGLQLGMSFSI